MSHPSEQNIVGHGEGASLAKNNLIRAVANTLDDGLGAYSVNSQIS